MSLVQNERTKLTASCINGVAIAAIVAGSVSPLVTLAYTAAPHLPAWRLGALSVVWILAGIGLHLFNSTVCPERAEGMTAFEIYAIFGVPLILLGLAWLGVW